MASIQRQGSSGSDSDPRYANVDERKRKRMISNRESARRSRMKKQKQMEDLVNEANQLENAIAMLRQNIDCSVERYVEIESANNILRAQALGLTDRLHSLNSVLQMWAEISGPNVEIPEIPDPLIKPWQLPCPMQPVMASANMFQH